MPFHVYFLFIKFFFLFGFFCISELEHILKLIFWLPHHGIHRNNKSTICIRIYIYIISEWLHQMLTIFNDTSHWWQIIYAWCAYTYIVFQYKFNELICDVPFWFLWPIQFYRWIQPMQWCDTWTIELHNNLLRLIKIVHVNSVVLICIFFSFLLFT